MARRVFIVYYRDLAKLQKTFTCQNFVVRNTYEIGLLFRALKAVCTLHSFVIVEVFSSGCPISPCCGFLSGKSIYLLLSNFWFIYVFYVAKSLLRFRIYLSSFL